MIASVLQPPAWVHNATIYQVNTRQFSAQGNFAGVTAELPRLAEMGVRIVYLMPIHPIGEMNRKGSLGSPYAVRDYFGVNPEFGTLEDLRQLVDCAHALGMYVIIDWVANHTAWDNPLRDSHPEWYARDYKGDFRPTPWWDWSDIIDLDYRQRDLWPYMTEALCYWLREADIDGYRCDVAGMVPLAFWEQARDAMESIKPVFMLAEWQERDLHRKAFDAAYSWDWYDAVSGLALGKKPMDAVFKYFANNERSYPDPAMRMTYTSNHDKNAWDGTEFEAFGDAADCAAVLSFVGDGIPMIYSGQEAGNRRRLAFFERDPIRWQADPRAGRYARLIALRAENSALWSGAAGSVMLRVPNTVPQQVLSFVRQNAATKVFALLNFSGEAQDFRCQETLYHGHYRDWFSGEDVSLDENSSLQLAPWSWRILVQSDRIA